MKKYGFKNVFLIITLFFAMFPALPAKAINPGDTIDQSCSASEGGIGGRFLSSSWQTFKPSLNRMHKAVVIASIEGLENQTIAAHVYKGDTLIASSPPQIVEPVQAFIGLHFEFGSFEVIPNETYRLVVISSTGWADWVTAADTCYARGTAYSMNSTFDSDYRFTTLGTNYTPENPSNPSNPTTPSTPSTTIAPPTGVAAAVVNNSIKVAWVKSTTADITGYRIFKSTQATTGFVGLGTTDKNASEFFDTQVTEGQTYYYIVKAYKNNTESASSNTANIAYTAAAAVTPPTEESQVTEAKAEDVKQEDKKPQENKNLILGLDPVWFYSLLTTLLALLGVGGFFLYRFKFGKKKTLPTVNKGS